MPSLYTVLRTNADADVQVTGDALADTVQSMLGELTFANKWCLIMVESRDSGMGVDITARFGGAILLTGQPLLQ